MSDPVVVRPRVEIRYCTQCRWLLRAAWMAQELLTTFDGDLGEVALIPATGGYSVCMWMACCCGTAKPKTAFPISRHSSRKCATRSTLAARWGTVTGRPISAENKTLLAVLAHRGSCPPSVIRGTQ